MLSIQETIEISNIFVDQIFSELLAIIFDTFLFEHTVYSVLLVSGEVIEATSFNVSRATPKDNFLCD